MTRSTLIQLLLILFLLTAPAGCNKGADDPSSEDTGLNDGSAADVSQDGSPSADAASDSQTGEDGGVSDDTSADADPDSPSGGDTQASDGGNDTTGGPDTTIDVEVPTDKVNHIVYDKDLPWDEISPIGVTNKASIWIYDPYSSADPIEIIPKGSDYSNIMPFWNPTKTKIVFASNRENPTRLDIWTANSDGTDLKRLTGNNGHNWTPAWSPDGNLIAFSSTRNNLDYVNEPWALDIFIMNANGTNQCFLADGGLQDEDPVFSKDSKTVYFIAENATNKFEIWEVPVGASGLCQHRNEAGPVLVGSNHVYGEDISLSYNGNFLLYSATNPDPDAGSFKKLNLDPLGKHSIDYIGSINYPEPWIGPDSNKFVLIEWDGEDRYISVFDYNTQTFLKSMVAKTKGAYFPRWASPTQ